MALSEKKISLFDPGDGDGGEFIIAKGGSNYKVTGNTAGGPTILDANGKVISRLAYEGQPNGVATLDANGVVAQAVLGQLKLTQVKYNSTDESTTATVGSVISVLKSDEITLAANDIAVVTYGGVLSNYNGGWAFLHPMISTDGGNNWDMAGTYSGVYGGGSSNKFYVSNVLLYPTASAQNVIFGVSYGNAAGQSDEVHWMSYKSLTVLVFRGQSS